MSLLQQIQESVVEEGSCLSSILLKLRLLASRLGSEALEEWVKHESEGYPVDSNVPPYRIVGVSYSGTFSGPFGAGIQNAPIPPHLIEKFASSQWTNYEIKSSIGAISKSIENYSENNTLSIDASNLMLLLQGKIYKEYACNEIKGNLSISSFYEIQQSVRSKILELTNRTRAVCPWCYSCQVW